MDNTREKLIELLREVQYLGGLEEKVADHLIANGVKIPVRKPVSGYEGQYEVDQYGRVFGVDRTKTVVDNGRIYDKPIAGKQMKQSLHTRGYKTVTLTKDGKTKTVYVHRIVAEAFIENPDNLPMVNHKDEDKTNNFVENLEWCTASYNRTYGKAIERHAKKLRGRKRKDDFCSYGERKDKCE